MTTKKASEGKATTIADDALVMAVGASGYQPISFADLAKAVRGTLQIGGRNLLKGSRSGQGWGIAPVDGVYVVPNSIAGEVYLYGTVLPLEIGKTYTLSFTAKATSNFKNMDVFLCAVAGGSIIDGLSLSTEWKRYVFTKTLNANFPTGQRFRIDNNGSFNGQTATLWVKDIKVEEGNIATAWTPAPEDLSDSWGGVIYSQPITYDLEQKGGTYGPLDISQRQVQECADSYLGFESLSSLCEFIGRSCEDESGVPLADNTDLCRCGLGNPRVDEDRPENSQSSSLWTRRFYIYSAIRCSGKDSVLLCLGSEHLCPQAFVGNRQRQVGGLAQDDYRGIIASRKEVAL